MRALCLAALVLAACGNHASHPADAAKPVDAAVDAPPPPPDMMPDANPLEPATLFGTGLCVDPACTQISPDVHPYTPAYPLWADAASKHRWIYLPPGTQIDTSDPDYWKFPQGTKIWKEFDVDTVRVETRYIAKVGPGDKATDWFYVAYQWNATNDDTTAQPMGVMNANGTTHDIPARFECKQCHEALLPTRILGFGAIQLDWANPSTDELDLDRLAAAGLLTQNPPGAASPHYPLPGDATQQAALGYLHANCGHCHNPSSPVYTDNGITMVLREEVGKLVSVDQTTVYTTAVDQPAMQQVGTLPADCKAGSGSTAMDQCIIEPGMPDTSTLIFRFESMNPAVRMPKIATKTVDMAGDTTLKAWISAMTPMTP